MKSEKFTNKEITELLRSIAAAYQLKNENRFKIIAYQNAADTVEHLNRELHDIWQEGKLSLVPSIGASLRSSLEEYFENGTSKHFESILADIPAPVFQLMKVPTIGPKKAFKLVKELHLENSKNIREDIKKAAQKNKIEELETFGEKSQQDILEALDRYEQGRDRTTRMPLPYAAELAEEIIAYLKKDKHIIRADALGSLRRMSSTIGDIDIAVALKEGKPSEIIEHFLQYPYKTSVDNSGEKKASIIVPPHVRVDLRVQEIDNYGPMLQYFTGNKAHNIKLREYALKKGYTISEYGIKKLKDPDATFVPFATEEAFYEFLGLEYIPPEIRDGGKEIDLAIKHKIPKLVQVSDMKGDLHTHSSYDLKPSHDFGKDSYETLAKRAHELGYEYVAFSDHNPKTSGHSKEEIIAIMKKRKEYIDKLFTTSKVERSKYFISLETDIQPDGSLALPEEAIQYVDFLIVSVHSVFSMNVEEMTKRVLRALSYPKVKVLAHPTGRLLGKRDGYELDWKQIFEYVKKHTIALEINSWPQRLDLPDTLVAEGVGNGVQFVIDTDAHAVEDMDNMKYGVSVARRGWATKNDIMNTLPYQEFKKWVEL